MIHIEAERWDNDSRHQHVEHYYVPHGRPCDRCGEPVVEGYIHDECLKAELASGYFRGTNKWAAAQPRGRPRNHERQVNSVQEGEPSANLSSEKDG